MHSFLKQSTASQSRAIGPFLDDTDFKTAETGLTIANTDIKLVINGAASANKNSGGGTHRVNGVYGVTFDATDTATVGEMHVSVVVSGALPVFATFVVLEEAVYDALFAASAPGYVSNAPVNVAQFGGTNLTSASGIPEVKVASIANNAITAAATAADFTTEVTSGLSTLDAAGVRTAVGLASANLDTQLSTIDDFLDTEIAAIKAKTDNLPSDPADASDISGSFSTVNTTLSTIAGYLDTEIAAIKAKTDNLPAAPAATGDIPSAATIATAVLTTQMTESYATDGAAPTLAQAQFESLAMLTEKSVSGTTLTTKKRDGSTTAATYTLNDSTSPTSITRAS